MSYKFDIYRQDNYVLFTLNEDFDPVEDLQDIHEQTSNVANQMSLPFYRLVDLNAIDFDFGTVMNFLQEDTGNEPGTATDKRFYPVFVGNDKLAQLVADSLIQEQYGGIQASCFPTVYAAHEFVKDHRKRKNAQTQSHK